MGFVQLLRSGRSLPAARRCLEQVGLTWEAPVLSRNLASLPEPITESPPENSRDGKVFHMLDLTLMPIVPTLLSRFFGNGGH